MFSCLCIYISCQVVNSLRTRYRHSVGFAPCSGSSANVSWVPSLECTQPAGSRASCSVQQGLSGVRSIDRERESHTCAVHSTFLTQPVLHQANPQPRQNCIWCSQSSCSGSEDRQELIQGAPVQSDGIPSSPAARCDIVLTDHVLSSGMMQFIA